MSIGWLSLVVQHREPVRATFRSCLSSYLCLYLDLSIPFCLEPLTVPAKTLGIGDWAIE